MNSILEQLERGERRIGVIGLGYVGLPLAVTFARKYPVVAYDHNPQRIALLQQVNDPSHEIPPEDFENLNIEFTADEQRLDNAHIYIVAVPTPIDRYNRPDITLLLKATQSVARHLKRGDIVVYESTVYPCCTEDECLPLLESISGLKVGTDFGLGYSPERINPGDKTHRLKSVVKVVSAADTDTCQTLAQLYSSVIDAGVYVAPSIKVAEAAKIIENTQRDVNIALMNELSIICNMIDIDTQDVINAASTKWNFIRFVPGLVGGHCIGIDPYYLDYKASELGYHTQIINRGRFINDNMSRHVVNITIKKMLNKKTDIISSRVLIMGFTYKENVCDCRNTRAIDILHEMQSYGIKQIDIVDPVAIEQDVEQQYNIQLQPKPEGRYNAIFVTVGHDCFRQLDEEFFKERLLPNGVVCDVRGLFRGKFHDIDIWYL
ncbi:MAG: nucleotide sugar dehydrogenase [Bacteroidales bacterium]|nr:nucleotide sugar dehydrogenase [Bacteroidales bacterium]